MKQYIYDGTKYVLHEDVVGLSELPTPSAKYLDKAYLLTADQTGYEKGAIYECHEVTPATDPKTYEWVKVTTSGDGIYKVYSGNYDSVEGEFYDTDGTALPKVDKQQYYDIATRATWIYYSAWSGFFRLFNDVVGMEASQMLSPLITQYYPELNAAHFRCMNVSGNDGGLIEGFIYKLDRISVTPEAGDSPVNEGWWEVDSTTGKTIQTEDTEVVSGKLYFDFVWTQVKPQQSVFPGTLDEWDALPASEKAKYDFIATPDEAVEDIADAVIDGDMRAVTSNAVAQVVPSDASSSNKLVSASALNNRVREVFRIPYNMTITNFLARFTSIGIHVGEVFIEGNIGGTSVDSWCSYEANIVSVTDSYVGNIKLTNLSNGTEFLYKSYNAGSFNWVLAFVSGPGIKTVQLPPTKILTVEVGAPYVSVFASIQIQGSGSRMVLLEYNNTSLYGKILRDGTEYTTERGSSGFTIYSLTFTNSSSKKFTITNLADTETETITVIGNVIGVEVN